MGNCLGITSLVSVYSLIFLAGYYKAQGMNHSGIIAGIVAFIILIIIEAIAQALGLGKEEDDG